MENQTLSRQELYDLVWSESMLSLSKKYNISDVGLRKICIRMSIPTPQNGHWQKIQFRKKVNQPPLTPNYRGDAEVTLMIRSEDMKHVSPDGLSPLKALQNEIENDLKSKLYVPEKLTNPDKLIIAARESLNSKDRYEHNGLVLCQRGELDIKVAKPNVARALRFMDTLIKALRGRGHDIQIKSDATNVIVEEGDIKVQFREKLKREIVKGTHWDNAVYHPTGILAFQIYNYSPKEWKDGKLPIEEQLSKIIAQLELTGKEKKEWRIQSNINSELRKEKERIEKEFQTQKEKELAAFKETLQKASRWHKAVNLRSYIDSVEQKALETNGISEDLRNWLEWARKKAEWYDPFIECEDELLNEVDRETLTLKQKPPYYGW